METTEASSQLSLGAPPAAAATGILLTLAGASFVAHVLVAGNYGYFRDELYYIADGYHLQAGYVDQPLLMGWLAALLRASVGNGLVAIHIIPALACAAIIVLAGLMARELGGGRTAQAVAAVAALFTVNFMASGSLFSMDVLDQLWWTLASFVLLRLLRRDDPRLWVPFGLVASIAFLTKLTVLFFLLAVALALLATPGRRYLRTRWPWLAVGIAFVGLLPYIVWNASYGWPTLEFWQNYGVRSTPLEFFTAQLGQLNPIVLPLAAAGLVFYFREAGQRYRLLGWTFVLAYLVLTVLGAKPYFLSPAYPILFAGGGVAFDRFRPGPLLAWMRPAYIGLIAAVGLLLAPFIMPILPTTTLASLSPSVEQVLGDRLGWSSLTQTVERVYAGLPADERARACVLTSNYGEAGALQLLSEPGSLPPVISGHNNYYLWGPGSCTGDVLILVGYSRADVEGLHGLFADVTLAATEECAYCTELERSVPVYVASHPTGPIFPQQWALAKHYD